MSASGTVYGVVLNDRQEYEALADRFHEKPYEAPPSRPVIYIKPRQCVTQGAIPAQADAPQLKVAATIALLFARDATRVSAEAGWAAVGGVALAIDVFVPHADYYRPAIPQKTRDGTLPLGTFVAPVLPDAIETRIDGAVAHRWTLDRLIRSAPQLIADLSAYMTLRAGDILMVGLPGDAPTAGEGQTIEVVAHGLPTLRTRMAGTLA